MRHLRFISLAAGLALTAAGIARADSLTGYKIQPIVKLGDTVAGLKIRASGDFEFGSFNDNGQIALVTENQAEGEMLLGYSGGAFIPIAVGGQSVSGVKWPSGLGFWSPVQMNQQGDIVFATSDSRAIYRWDHQSGQVSIVATAGTPAVGDLTFTAGGGATTAAIDDYGEVAFQAMVKDTAGKVQRAIFFLGRDGKLVPVVLPGQMVDGVGTIQPAADGAFVTLTNSGVSGFQARRSGDKADGAFIWEDGTITPVVLAGTDAPGGGKFALIGVVFVNNQNPNVAVAGNLDGIGKD